MDTHVAGYINKQKSPQKEICLALRKIVLSLYPEIQEEMKWGAIVYDGGRYYIAAVRYGVNFGFAISGLKQEDIRQFRGSGKTMRHIKIETLTDIDEKRMTEMIQLVKTSAHCKGC